MRIPFARIFDSYRGAGEAAPTVPALDGPFSPNRELESADAVSVSPDADNLIDASGSIQFSSGNIRIGILSGKQSALEDHRLPITAMAGSPSGAVAVALKGGSIALRGPAMPLHDISLPINADIAALAFDDDGLALYASVGSLFNDTSAWTRDLLERRRAGSVWKIHLPSQKAECLCVDLAYPNGLLARKGELLFSEAWTSSVKRLEGGKPMPVAADLPGYPSRISKANDGGFWLAVMAPRNQLLEFILREPGYRRRMLAEVDPQHWIAPSLRPPASFLEPMQQGAQRALGILKPWAPGFSIGLVAKFDSAGKPVRSYWSRADGSRHGITSVAESAGKLLFSSRAQNAVMSLALEGDGK